MKTKPAVDVDKIRRLKQKGLSQREIAKICKCSPSTVSRALKVSPRMNAKTGKMEKVSAHTKFWVIGISLGLLVEFSSQGISELIKTLW